MRNHICLIILYTFTCILYSCSIEKEYNSFNIIYCKELHSGLQYCNSCKTIEYGEKKYAIEMCVYYGNYSGQYYLPRYQAIFSSLLQFFSCLII